MTPEELDALAAKLMSQVGDDVQVIYDTEALFKSAAAALRAQAEVTRERDAMRADYEAAINSLAALMSIHEPYIFRPESEWREQYDEAVAVMELARTRAGGDDAQEDTQ